MRRLSALAFVLFPLGCGGASGDAADFPKAVQDRDPVQLVLIDAPKSEPVRPDDPEEPQDESPPEVEDDRAPDDEEAPEESPADDPTAAPSDVAAPPASAKVTGSGLAHRLIRAGTGSQRPKAADKVEVHYSGWTTDGKLFDSSYQRGTPTQFPLSAVIKGWTEGVPLMVEGEIRRFWIPADLAYGPKTPGSGKPGGMLVFNIELIRVNP